MKKTVFAMLLVLTATSFAAAQIRVNPTGVNVNSQNPTTVFLTFGPIPAGYVPAEAIWCGELIPAPPPAIGNQCRPDTIFGSLPARLNLSQASGNGGFTDIMGIPASVVRRAYQAAVDGADSGFFYVRRFVSTAGQPDQFVAVTCRMTGGGARVPFALTDVQIKTASKEPILFLKTGESLPEIVAEIRYNGTGRLKGRWELVKPGEAPPADRDLLTEATLPLELRGTQKRYSEVGRFNHFLPPIGKFTLKFEEPAGRLAIAQGQYILLLRIEATDDKESDSNLGAVGVGSGIVHSGAVASFPMPVLKFFVGGEGPTAAVSSTETSLSPNQEITVDPGRPLVFSWSAPANAAVSRLEVFDEAGAITLSAILLPPISSYRAPAWFVSKYQRKKLSWRIVSFDETGAEIIRPGQ